MGRKKHHMNSERILVIGLLMKLRHGNGECVVFNKTMDTRRMVVSLLLSDVQHVLSISENKRVLSTTLIIYDNITIYSHVMTPQRSSSEVSSTNICCLLLIHQMST